MNCKKCGLPLKTGDVFCASCGTKVEQVATQTAVSQDNGKGLASMILGIIGILLCWVAGISTACSIVGLVFALRNKNSKFSKVGLILNIIALVLQAGLIIFVCYEIYEGLIEPLSHGTW